MDLYAILKALYRILRTITFLGTCWFLLKLLVFCVGVPHTYSLLKALMEITAWFLYIPANLTDTVMFGLVSRCSSQFLMHAQGASLGTVLSVSLIVFFAIVIYIMWRKLSPEPENAEWQGIWRGFGQTLVAWGPPMSWDFTLEHLRDPEKLSEYLSKGLCSSERSEGERLIWGLACAYRALYNTVLERESFQTEIRTKGGSLQVNLDRSQEAPISMSVASVKGQKWKRLYSRLEWEEEEVEELEEDPSEGPFSEPQQKTLNHELSKLFNEMWDVDFNRFAPGKDYAIELQGKADAVQQGDSAARHLFHYVNEERLKNTKTFATFISLLDNYETSTGVEEVVTPEEIAENNCFLDAILMTGVMKLAHQYLVKKKLAKPNLADFKYQLYDIWFQLYPRKEGDRPDSCGFEHVFVGETRHGKQILGLHNWVQFYLQEKHKQIDYKGYIARKNKTRPDRDDQVLSIQFSWKGSVKPIGSNFIGVSPEFEFALYTVIFLLSEERVTRETVKIEEYELQIVVCRHGRHIGTAYPVLLNTNNED